MIKSNLKEIVSGKRWGMLGILLSILHFTFFLIIVILNRTLPFLLVHYGVIEQPEGKITLSQYFFGRALQDLEYYLTYPVELFEQYFRNIDYFYDVILLFNSLIWGFSLTLLFIFFKSLINKRNKDNKIDPDERSTVADQKRSKTKKGEKIMSAILIIILALTVNSLPPNVKEFSVEMSPTKTLHFAKQADGGWEATKAQKNKSIVTFYVDGLTITTKMNGKEHKIDASKFLGIKTADQIKGLKKIKMGPKEIKVEKKDSGILLHMGENPIKISWKEK